MNIKEFDLILRQSSASTRELTTQARERYSRDGEIFMAENTGEISNQKPIPSNPSPDIAPKELKEEVPIEQQVKAKDAFTKADEGRILTPEEEQTRAEMIKRGRGPVIGGAPTIDISSFTNPNTRELGLKINRIDFELLQDMDLLREYYREALRLPSDVPETERTLIQARLLDLMEQASVAKGESSFQKEIREYAVRGSTDLTKRWELVRKIEEAIDKAPSIDSSQFPTELLFMARYFKETREMLINRILFKSYEDISETNNYEINFYAGSNLDILLGYLSKDDPEMYSYYLRLKSEAAHFHQMNSKIIGGSLDEFIQIAKTINVQPFIDMQKMSGVPEAMRLYEQKFQEFLARDKRISTEGYIDLRDRVAEELRMLNDIGLVKSAYISEREGQDSKRMSEWEITRALNVGRIFYNLMFRAAEQIATGQVPAPEEEEKKFSAGRDREATSDPQKRFASFPQESAVRIMNWMQWMTYRFNVATPRGGTLFLANVKDKFFEFLNSERVKLGINEIKEFGGMNVKEMEVGGMFAISGIYSSWRLENMAFKEIKIKGTTKRLREWVDDPKFKSDVKEAKNLAKDPKKMEEAQGKLLEAVKPLIEGMDIGLAILLSQEFAGKEKEVGYKVRQAIWEKVAINNLPLMIDYLTGLKAPGTDIKPLEELKAGWDNDKWERFRRKVVLGHELNIKKAINPDSVKEIKSISFDNDETSLKKAIMDEGKKLAPHLADIQFPYIAFMNDIPFEDLDYAGPGDEFYKRRTGGDFPSFNKAEGAFIGIMSNPGGIGMQKGLESFDEITKGIESPAGTEDAQKKVYPMFEAWTDWITDSSKFLGRQALWKSALEAIRAPTSLAQVYSGHTALSLNETQQRAMLDEAIRIGILSQDLLKKLKKKKRLSFFNIIAVLLRDFFYVPFIHGPWEYIKATSKLQ